MRQSSIMLLIAAAFALAACESSKESPPPQTGQAEVLPSGLARVEPDQVCMANDRFMGKPQIPVAVDGRTYYGCCPMCKERLANEPGIRSATDPVTGEVVDKASAVIAQDGSGMILYFASEDTLSQYRPASSKPEEGSR